MALSSLLKQLIEKNLAAYCQDEFPRSLPKRNPSRLKIPREHK